MTQAPLTQALLAQAPLAQAPLAHAQAPFTQAQTAGSFGPGPFDSQRTDKFLVFNFQLHLELSKDHKAKKDY